MRRYQNAVVRYTSSVEARTFCSTTYFYTKFRAAVLLLAEALFLVRTYKPFSMGNMCCWVGCV